VEGPGQGSRTARPRVRVRGSGRDAQPSDSRDAQYDLLTAALLGLAIGAGTTLLFRRGPSGGRPITPAWRVARKGARLAGRGARYAWGQGQEAWDRIPHEEIGEKVRDYFESARESIDDYVESELKDLRKAIRRRRQKLGI
jgi:gas vesicle protein